MKTRLDFHKMLVDVLKAPGKWLWDPFKFDAGSNVQDAIAKEAEEHVHFQPPPSVHLSYPCIVYSISNIDIRHANNHPYKTEIAYKVVLIDEDPDTELRKELEKIPRARFSAFYTSENLNHFVYTIYH